MNRSNDQLLLGKLPPQAIDLESAILGAVMLEKDALDDVIQIIDAESFYKDLHKEIFLACIALYQRSEPIDMLTVTMELRERAQLEFCGGAVYITELTRNVISSANIEYHARLISELSIKRQLITLSSEVQTQAYEDSSDPFTLCDMIDSKLLEITGSSYSSGSENIAKTSQIVMDEIEQRTKTGELKGIPSGFEKIDKITNGWQNSDLIIIAARPGMGKTALVMDLAKNAAEQNIPVGIASVEMSEKQLIERLIAGDSEINNYQIKFGKLSQSELETIQRSSKKIGSLPLYITDRASLGIHELRSIARTWVKKYGIKMLVVDYLQLMTAPTDKKNSQSREVEISTISRGLKAIAKELDIPVIALSQLNRSVESRGGDKRPNLSDLRESGAIEQDADMVIFLYRPEYYGMSSEDGQSVDGVTELIIAKNRSGRLDNIWFHFEKSLTKFMDSKPVPEFNPSDDEPGF